MTKVLTTLLRSSIIYLEELNNKYIPSFKAYLDSRVLLRFEFDIPHQILYTAFAVCEKLSLSCFWISYQNSEISSQKKMPISHFQSHFSRSKICRICSFLIFEEYQNRRSTFFEEKCLNNFTLWKRVHFLLADFRVLVRDMSVI